MGDVRSAATEVVDSVVKRGKKKGGQQESFVEETCRKRAIHTKRKRRWRIDQTKGGTGTEKMRQPTREDHNNS